MMYIAILLALLSVGADAASIEARTFDANQLVDFVLKSVRVAVIQNDLDPVSLPDLKASFSKKIGFVKVSGSASLTNGALGGLSTIFRMGDCSASVEPNQAIVSCGLGINNLKGKYDAKAKFMEISVGATASVSISEVRVAFRFSGVPGGSPVLDQFAVTSVSTVDVNISGLGVLGWTLGAIAKVVVNSLKGILIGIIEKQVKSQVTKALSQVTLPSA